MIRPRLFRKRRSGCDDCPILDKEKTPSPPPGTPISPASGPATGSFNGLHRLALCELPSRTLKQGLNLLGIDVPERM